MPECLAFPALDCRLFHWRWSLLAVLAGDVLAVSFWVWLPISGAATPIVATSMLLRWLRLPLRLLRGMWPSC